MPFPEHGSVPSEKEALLKEEYLTDQYPLFKKVKETVKTLDTKIVEKITPNDPENPDNVKRVEFILSEENYEDLFPRRHPSYTYKRLLQVCLFLRPYAQFHIFRRSQNSPLFVPMLDGRSALMQFAAKLWPQCLLILLRDPFNLMRFI